jgi:hypothetical protein
MKRYTRGASRLIAITQTLVFICLFVNVLAGAQTAPATAKLDVLNQDGSTVDRDGPFTITVVARGLPITIERALFTVTDNLTGSVLDSAFSLPVDGKSRIDPEHVATLTIHVEQPKLAQTKSATGALILFYKAGDSPNLLTSARWGFKLVHAVPDLTVYSRPNDVIRSFPFTPVKVTSKNGEACNSYHLSPASLPKPTIPKSFGDAYTAGTDASRPQGVKIDAVFNTNDVCFETTIPGQYTELKAKFHVDDPSINKPVDFDADLRVKDYWAWRGFAALLATIPALALIYWTTTIRRRMLNRNQRDEVTNRLAQFLASNPGLGDDSSVTLVRQMILDSTVEDKMGDFDASAQSLASASGRLDQLFAAPPAASVPISQSGLAIRILNPASCVVSGRKVSFIIGQPNTNWPTNQGVYTWTLETPGGVTIASSSGVDLKRFDHTFDSGGPFVVKVDVDGANQESRDFDVLTEPPASVIEQFKIVQSSVVLITFLLAAGTAYVSTQDATTFGTFGDYFKLIANAFGVSGGAGGVATVLTAVKGR